MKERISSIVKELKFATLDDIKKFLEDVNEKNVEHQIKIMIKKDELIEILPEENNLGRIGYVEGPNLEIKENFEVCRLIKEKEIYKHNNVVKWNIVAERLTSELDSNIDKLIEDIDKGYKDPRALEIEYFDYSIKYHELFRMLNEKVDNHFLKNIAIKLENCRRLLSNLDYRETP
jgi:aconitase B